MKHKKLLVAFFWIFILFSPVTYGQFTYLETGIALNTVPIRNQFGHTLTSYTNVSVRLAGTFRITRYLGIGVEGSMPVFQSSKFSFEKGTFFKFDAQYMPRKFNYTFKESPKVSVFARFYLDTRLNMYVDARLSVFNFTEHFEFYRDSIYASGNHPAIQKYEINKEIKYLQIIPGVSIGAKPRIGKHFFANINLGINFYLFDKTSFKYKVPYAWDFSYYDYKRVELNTQLGNMKGAFLLNVGFGYFF